MDVLMEHTVMNLEKAHFDEIENFVKERLPDWVAQIPSGYSRDFEIRILERMVKVEEELKYLRENFNTAMSRIDDKFSLVINLIETQRVETNQRFEQVYKHLELLQHSIDKRFEQVDKRFEQVDKRFESFQHSIDKRFEQMDKRFDDVNKKFTILVWAIGLGFTLTITAMTIMTTLLK